MAPKVSSKYKERRQQEIMAAALRVFRTKGFEPTSMQDIVKEAGVSRGCLYSYFASTEEIFRALVKQYDDFRLNALDFISKEFTSGWAALDVLLTGLESGLLDIGTTPAPVMFEYSVISWRKKNTEIEMDDYHVWVDRFAAFLQLGVDTGEFKPVMGLNTIAQILLSFINGISFAVIQYGPKAVDITGQVEGLRQMLKELLHFEGAQ